MSVSVDASWKEEGEVFFSGKARWSGICIYRVCSTPASNQALTSSYSLFLFAYDGKISSCLSNPEHLSQPMKGSICFSTFPLYAPPTGCVASYKVGWKLMEIGYSPLPASIYPLFKSVYLIYRCIYRQGQGGV